MDITTAVVCIVAIVLLFALLFFALHQKGDVRAGGTLGNGSFFIDVKDRKRTREGERNGSVPSSSTAEEQGSSD